MSSEHPIFTKLEFSYSVSEFLNSLYPKVPVNIDPSQQVEKLPAFYLQYYADTRRDDSIYGTGNIKLYVDIVYEEDYNVKNLFTRYEEVAQNIDNHIKELTYNVYDESSEGEDKIIKRIPIDTHENRWRMDLSALHYSFEVVLRIKWIDDIDKITNVNSDVKATIHERS